MAYIFGSFTRRKQSQPKPQQQQEGLLKKRHSTNIETCKISHDRSLSTPSTLKKTQSPPTPRAKSVCGVSFNDNKFKCTMCRKYFIEPRVLNCLHTFCLKCLEKLAVSNWQDDRFEESSRGNSDCSSEKTLVEFQQKCIQCPICGKQSEIPTEGVFYYPPNYILQNQMVLATLNAEQTYLLCDMCPTENAAISRCMDCAFNFCHNCEEIHLRQKAFSTHNVLKLEEARRKGITQVRRQIMCLKHPNVELSSFCNFCNQVVCQECINTIHKEHKNEAITRVITPHLTHLKLISEEAKTILEQSALKANRLNSTSKKIEIHCGKIQNEVETFFENYIRCLQEHRQNLIDQIEETKREQLEEITWYKIKLHKKVREARDVAYFLEDLLNEGTEVEILSFVKPVKKRIESLNSVKEINELLPENVQFLSKEIGQYTEESFPLFGVITTQTVSPEHSILNTEDLNKLRVGRKTKIILETRDRLNKKVERGGEEIFAEIRYRDAGVSKLLKVDIDDNRDGTYCISFVPDVSGKLVLCVKIGGQPIKDNPVPIVVRSMKPHHGTFHCCSFCSSSGSKEVSCGCGGKMPGGYKGCGHGHEGHPGKRHWSCCGNILEHSECGRINQHLQYQFTL